MKRRGKMKRRPKVPKIFFVAKTTTTTTTTKNKSN